MKPFRKLRAVENCPQPEPPPFRRIQYGFAGGHKIERLAAMPTAQEISTRARAQSLLSTGGQRAELPDYATALRIIAAPKSMPAAAEEHDSPSRAVAAGSNPPAIDDEAGWDEYVRRAMAGEIKPF
jgi:hypothetical protein